VSQYRRHFSNLLLSETDKRFVSFDGTEITVLGLLKLRVQYKNLSRILQVFIVSVERQGLIGRDWIQELKMDLNQLFSTQQVSLISNLDHDELIKELMVEYSDVFDNKPGKIREIQAKLTLRSDAKPVFIRSRNIPFARAK
jgi:hypothetical protein